LSYLRCNYRITGKEVDIDAIGGGIALGSWGGGSGTNRAFGGFIMGSYNGPAYATYHIISAYGAMSQYFGSGQFDSGYKIFPFAVWDASVPIGGTASVAYQYAWSVSGSLIMIRGIKRSAFFAEATYIDSAAVGIPYTAWATQLRYVDTASGFASGETIHIIWAGWIISGP